MITVWLRILHAHEGRAFVLFFSFFCLWYKGNNEFIRWVGKYFILFLLLNFFISCNSSCRIDVISIIWRAEKYCSGQGRRASLFLIPTSQPDMLAVLCHEKKRITEIWGYRLFQLFISPIKKCSQASRWPHLPDRNEGRSGLTAGSAPISASRGHCVSGYEPGEGRGLGNGTSSGVCQRLRLRIVTNVLSSVGTWTTCFLCRVETSLKNMDVLSLPWTKHFLCSGTEIQVYGQEE